MPVSDAFLATLAGAAVAGVIGLVTLLMQQELSDRRRLNEEILAPAFNYLAAFSRDCVWQAIPEPTWSSVDSYHWLKVPGKFRFPLRETAIRLDAYGTEYARYSELMGGPGWEKFGDSARQVLSKYAGADGRSISSARIGLDAGATIQIQWIVSGILPYVLMNPGAPDAAWDQLDRVKLQSTYWARAAILSLRKVDPATLSLVFKAIEDNELAPKARGLAKSLDDAYGLAFEAAEKARALLAARLGVAAALRSVKGA